MTNRFHKFAAMAVVPAYLVAAGFLAAGLLMTPASAQVLLPANPMLQVPPPPPLPQPRIEAPVVPKFDAIPSQPTAPLSNRSFGDRVTDCLQDGTAAGLSPSDRSAYSRGCANR